MVIKETISSGYHDSVNGLVSEATDTSRSSLFKPLAVPVKKSLRFYAIMIAIVFADVLTVLKDIITSTSLPFIADLGGGDLYI
jgi:hypothetical protein